ncbi:MAG: potassium-transporting ATPase subunit B, partial [Rikenellaceae bacterium]
MEKNTFITHEQMLSALKESIVKLDPRTMMRNPIMFTVLISTAVMFIVCLSVLFGWDGQGTFGYNFTIFLILLITLLFANFAEALAEARGKAQAESLRKTREHTPANKLVNGKLMVVSSSTLRNGDIFECSAGEQIPTDGEIIEGLASIDESAITGESAPVIREAGGDKTS